MWWYEWLLFWITICKAIWSQWCPPEEHWSASEERRCSQCRSSSKFRPLLCPLHVECTARQVTISAAWSVRPPIRQEPCRVAPPPPVGLTSLCSCEDQQQKSQMKQEVLCEELKNEWKWLMKQVVKIAHFIGSLKKKKITKFFDHRKWQ